MEAKENSEQPDLNPPEEPAAGQETSSEGGFPPEGVVSVPGGEQLNAAAPAAGEKFAEGVKPAKGKLPEKMKEKPADGPETPGAGVRLRPPLHIRVLRWLIGLLVVFGLGMLAAIFLFYLPQQRRTNDLRGQLQQANNELTAQQQQANDRIASLEAQLDSMKPLAERNQALESELDQARLHAAILTARSDVAAAQLALARSEPARVRISVEKTPETLDLIAGLLPAGQEKVVDDLRSRLELALSELEDNAFAAESDLTVLATSLLELENAYFARP